MTEQLYNIAKDQNETSNGLLNDIRKRSSLNRMYEKQSLALKKKLVEERKKAYDVASRKEGEGKGGLGFLRDLFLLRFLRGRGRGGGFGRGGGARPPVGPTGGGLGITPRITPKNNIVPFNKPRIGTPRVGALAILGTGIDFTSRLGGGQNILQAGLGAGGGLAGALAGAKYGAIAGSFAGPVGTLIGGVGGSLIGGLAGGSIADLLSGANRRRGEELERVTLMSRKTEFSKASDDFDVVLDKFEGDTAPMLKSMKSEEEGESPSVPMMDIPSAPKGPGVGKIIGEVLKFIAIEAGITALLAVAPIPGSRIAAFLRLGNIARRFNKIVKFTRVAKKVRRFVPAKSIAGRLIINRSLKASRSRLIQRNIARNNLLPNRISRAVKRGNFPAKSRVGLIKRQGANELLMTRIDNILANIRRKSVLFPERVKGFSNQGVLSQFTRGPLRSNVIRRNRFRPDPRLSDIMDDTEGLSRITLDQIKKNVRKTPSGQDPKILEQIVGGLRKEGKIDPIGGSIINPGTKFNKGKTFGSGGDGKVNPAEIFGRFKQLDLFQPKAEGGRVEAGKPYIVGEIGKELFVPDASGEIIPNEDLPSTNLLVINKEPETVIVPQVITGSSDTPIVSNTVNPYDVVAKYAQMTGLFTV